MGVKFCNLSGGHHHKLASWLIEQTDNAPPAEAELSED
jgi:hypothetical protein